MKEEELYELALFAGAGGGILGGKLLGWRCIGAVERDDYCQRVLLQRQRDGILPPFPIWDDMRTFTKRNNNVRPFIKALRRVAHRLVISAGFPCQPFSNAGKRLGADDDRNGWPWTIRSIREIRPAYALLENVPGLLTSGYFDTVLGDLAACGYDARWRVLSAAELGAPHQRDRLWIVAYPNTSIERTRELSIRPRRSQQASTDSNRLGEVISDAHRVRSQAGYTDQAAWKKGQANQLVNGGQNMAYSHSQGYAESWPIGSQQEIASTESCSYRGKWWATEPRLDRVVDGVAHTLDIPGTITKGILR